MGNCLSHTDNQEDLQENRRGGTGDGGAGNFRRKSRGLSRYSDDGKHVIENPLRIGAFNVRQFGVKKMKDETVVDILVTIVVQFDILVIQEVRDKSEESIYTLLDAINSKVKADGDTAGQFKLIVSPRLGRSHQHQEQAERVDVLDSEVYPDEAEDAFIREPFVVKFSSSAVSIDSFVLIAIHTQPTEAPKEIDRLADVHKWAEERMMTENVVIAGDFNAGARFVRPADWETCRLRGSEYDWLIADHLDTTSTHAMAAHDRIVTCGQTLRSAVVPDSAGVYRFDEDLGLDEETALRVSDHFPVFFSLQPSVHPSVTENIQTFRAIHVVDKRLPNLALEDLRDFKEANFTAETFYNSAGDLVRVDLRSQRLRTAGEVMTNLDSLKETEAGLVSYSALSAIKYKLNQAEDLDGSVQDLDILISVDVSQKRTLLQVQSRTELTS